MTKMRPPHVHLEGRVCHAFELTTGESRVNGGESAAPQCDAVFIFVEGLRLVIVVYVPRRPNRLFSVSLRERQYSAVAGELEVLSLAQVAPSTFFHQGDLIMGKNSFAGNDRGRGRDMGWSSCRNAIGVCAGFALLAAIVTLTGCENEMPASSTAAEALLRLNSASSLLDEVDERDEQQTLARIQTHIELIKSPLVLNAALAYPGIADLPDLRKRRTADNDEVAWLLQQIQVEQVEGAHLIRISISGRDQESAELLVGAVANAYLDKVVGQERNTMLMRVETLERQHRRLVEEIRQRRAAYKELVDAVDAVDGSTAASQRQYLERQKRVLEREIDRLRGLILRQRYEVKLAEAATSESGEEEHGGVLRDAIVSQILAKNEAFAAKKKELAVAQKELETIVNSDAAPPFEAVAGIQNRISELESQVEILRKDALAMIDAGDDAHAARLRKLKTVYGVTKAQLNEVVGEMEETERKIQRLTVHSPELQQRKDELENMEAVSTEVGLRLEKLQLELTVSESSVELVYLGP